MINYLDLISKCIGLLFTCSFLLSLVIEAAKKLTTEEEIKKVFGNLERFSLFISIILGIIIYIIFVVFDVLGINIITALDIIKIILIGIMYAIGCGVGSQIGYDKVIKIVKEIFIKGDK